MKKTLRLSTVRRTATWTAALCLVAALPCFGQNLVEENPYRKTLEEHIERGGGYFGRSNNYIQNIEAYRPKSSPYFRESGPYRKSSSPYFRDTRNVFERILNAFTSLFS